jgi:hypothetical protein
VTFVKPTQYKYNSTSTVKYKKQNTTTNKRKTIWQYKKQNTTTNKRKTIWQ